MVGTVGSKSRRKRRPVHRKKVLALRRAPGPPDDQVKVQIPKPRVTEYSTTIVVPVFKTRDAGPHQGSRGVYDVVLILGIPGRTSATTEINLDAALAGGDSLLLGSGLKLTLDSAGIAGTADVLPNDQGRLSQVRASVEAEGFGAAERLIYNLVVPSLSLISFQADVALEISGVLLTERSTQIKKFGATMLGTFQPAPEQLEGNLTSEVRPLLAAYREGLSANSPMYQALSFYKIIENVTALNTQRARRAAKTGAAFADPLLRTLPTDPADLTDKTEWEREVFSAYLGKSYTEVRDGLNDTIRNAVAHLAPGRDVRSADLLDDIEACRLAAPLLRYMARDLIHGELVRK
jgi:hypothetical protein